MEREDRIDSISLISNNAIKTILVKEKGKSFYKE